MKYFKFTILCLIILQVIFFHGCSGKKINSLEDIIPNVTISAGEEKSIVFSDLFYSEIYNPIFLKNDHVQISYESDTKLLLLRPDNEFEGMTLIEFEIDDVFRCFPLSVNKNKYYKFEYKPEKKYDRLTLFGSFNGWNRTDIDLTDENKDGVFEAEIALVPGNYQYKFFGDGIELIDPNNPNKVPNGFGDYNSLLTISEDPDSKVFLHQKNYEARSNAVIYFFYYESNDPRVILHSENVIALLNNKKVSVDAISVKENNISIQIPISELGDNKLLRVTVSKNGKKTNLQHLYLNDGHPVNNSAEFDWHDAIIYSLMIDRFKDGDESLNEKIVHDSLSDKANYMGGDLRGVIDKLNDGYFDSLGINTIWISPVYDNPNIAFREYPEPHRWFSGYHGYWPISSTRVEEKFGNIEDVKELVSIAHNHKIQVLLDFVSNHVHIDHPYFENHRDWFGTLELPDGRKNIRFWDEFRLTTWFEPYLPSFDFLGSQAVLDTIVANAVWWIKETNADGFRHDAVKHVPNEFWRLLLRRLKEKVEIPRGRKLYQVGETFGSYDLISSYVNNGQLSAQFNFNLYDTALPTFVNEGASFDDLDKEMHKTFSVYGENHLMSNIMDSHDKNRFMAYADGDLDASEWSAIEVGWNNPPQVNDPINYKKLILYMAYMNSIPGIPVVYYGSEFGMTGASDPDNRRMMRFDNELSQHERKTKRTVSEILKLRNAHTALRYGDFYTLTADENLYSYVRSDSNERVLVILNKSEEEQTFKPELPKIYNASTLIELTTGDNILLSETSKIKVDSWDWKMFVIK